LWIIGKARRTLLMPELKSLLIVQPKHRRLFRTTVLARPSRRDEVASPVVWKVMQITVHPGTNLNGSCLQYSQLGVSLVQLFSKSDSS